MTAAELAEVISRGGRPRTEKQGYTTAARAEELGLLRKRGRGAWDVPVDDASLTTPGALSAATAALFIECAKRLLHLPQCLPVSAAARVLLEAATSRRQVRSHPSAAAGVACGQTTNGASNGHRAVEVLEPPHGE